MPPRSSAPTLSITTGLASGCLLQRDGKDRSAAALTGTCQADGPVTATVRAGKKILRGLAGAKVGAARGGSFTATLAGIPVGGPYRVELACGDARAVCDDVWVGDLWLTGGQSNMEGVGFPVPGIKAIPAVRAFFLDDRWGTAKDPVNHLHDAVSPVHTLINGGNRPAPTTTGVSPAVGFAQELHRLSGIPQGVVPNAHGGTSMDQWSPAKLGEGRSSLYGSMVARARLAGGRFAGLIWYQGCSDCNPTAVKVYTQRMIEFCQAVRRDIGPAALPIVAVQIARVMWPSTGGSPDWDAIRDQQRLLPRRIRNLAVVPAGDLDLDDGIHISGPDQYRLGRRLAHAMRTLRGEKVDGKPLPPPIELKAFKVIPDPNIAHSRIVVEFANVVGGLRSAGLARGFALTRMGENLPPNPMIYKTILDGPRATLCCVPTLADLNVNDYRLHYLQGASGEGNITDDADRSLPGFGPLWVGRPRAITGFPASFEISTAQPVPADWTKLAPPSDPAAVGFVRRAGDGFSRSRDLIVAAGTANNLYWYRFSFDCPEAMDLELLYGYDGPAAFWLDGKLLHNDPAGTNPAIADAKSTRLKIAAGRHTVIAALGSNHGRAWGIFLRLRRHDRRLAAGKLTPDQLALPVWA
jgi:sialate O-acetylesterase